MGAFSRLESKVEAGRQIGGLAWRLQSSGELEFLLVTSRVSRHWLIPKGWPIAGKSDREAAMQEAFEEAGIRCQASDDILGSYRFQKLMPDGTGLACLMSIYRLTEIVELKEWPEMQQRERRWVAQREASEMVFDANLGRFLASLTRDWLERAAADLPGVTVKGSA